MRNKHLCVLNKQIHVLESDYNFISYCLGNVEKFEYFNMLHQLRCKQQVLICNLKKLRRKNSLYKLLITQEKGFCLFTHL